MAGFTTEMIAATDPVAMIDAIVTNLVNGGSTAWFTRVVPDITSPTVSKILLESTSAVDAYQTTDSTQTYRILITINKTSGVYQTVSITFGNSDQLKPLQPLNDDIVVQSGTPSFVIMAPGNAASVSQESNYRITLTDRGFALAIWATTGVNANNGSSFCVFQRPVNPTTGEAVVGGNAPIFALWHSAVASNESFFNWAVVREKDASASLAMGSTALPSRNNMFKVSLDWPHPNLFDNNSHVVKFPYGFATRRHLYLDEMDLMCLVNSAAFASAQDVKITMYGEATERQYRTVWGNVEYGLQIPPYVSLPKIVAGARIGILRVNGGI